MKTSIFKQSLMTLVTTVFMVSCTQNEGISDATEGSVILNVNTTVQNFIPDASTRVIDEVDPFDRKSYITKFEVDDRIGVYVFMEDGTMMYKNMPMTYGADGKWTGSQLYFYKNATYVAYSPYKEAVSELTLTKDDIIASITNYFTETVMADGLSTYKDCDLMTASATTSGELPVADANAITFNFSHAMSMVEFVIPIQNYITTAGYEYSNPVFGMILRKKSNAANAADETITPLALGKGVYRSLLAPAATGDEVALTFSGDLTVPASNSSTTDGTKPLYFSTQTAFKPEAGKFKRVKVSYPAGDSDAPSADVKERDLAIGDYYYADGGIIPGDTEAAKVPKKNLAGLIFSLSTSTEDQAHGWKQGYVVAIKTVSAKWGNAVNSEYLDTSNGEAKAAFIANMNGYDMTAKIKEVQGTGDNICTALNNFEPRLTNETASGWYCPSPGQLIAILEKLGGYTPSEGEDYFSHNNNRAAAVTALNTKMQAIVGDNSSGFGEFTWSAAEVSGTNIWTLQCKTWGSSAWIGISESRQRNVKQLPLRPVLAF